jgi:hypothetical protein
MSFGAGMGAGLGAGLGTGVAIGMSAGKRRACQEIREHVAATGVTIRDANGTEIDIETFLDSAVPARPAISSRSKFGLTAALLLGVAILGILVYWAAR